MSHDKLQASTHSMRPLRTIAPCYKPLPVRSLHSTKRCLQQPLWGTQHHSALLTARLMV
ncbi:MAG: hypothetical protein ACYT04_24640 [Nostoc sp.]